MNTDYELSRKIFEEGEENLFPLGEEIVETGDLTIFSPNLVEVFYN